MNRQGPSDWWMIQGLLEGEASVLDLEGGMGCVWIEEAGQLSNSRAQRC